jgi:hypothetical protein
VTGEGSGAHCRQAEERFSPTTMAQAQPKISPLHWGDAQMSPGTFQSIGRPCHTLDRLANRRYRGLEAARNTTTSPVSQRHSAPPAIGERGGSVRPHVVQRGKLVSSAQAAMGMSMRGASVDLERRYARRAFDAPIYDDRLRLSPQRPSSPELPGFVGFGQVTAVRPLGRHVSRESAFSPVAPMKGHQPGSMLPKSRVSRPATAPSPQSGRRCAVAWADPRDLRIHALRSELGGLRKSGGPTLAYGALSPSPSHSPSPSPVSVMAREPAGGGGWRGRSVLEMRDLPQHRSIAGLSTGLDHASML